MVTNVSYALLDAPVIAGRGDEPVVGTMTHARLLEEVAALAGALRHLGVQVSAPVLIDLVDDVDAVVAALATARLGGTIVTADAGLAPVALVSDPATSRRDGQLRVVRGDEVVAEPDFDWKLMIRAGRSDPAAVEVLDPGAAYTPERSVAEQLELLAGSRAPYDAGELRRLLGV